MTATIENILAIYDNATDSERHAGAYWYNEAHKLAWELDHTRPRAGAAVLAVLSPLLSWPKNMEYAQIAYGLKGYNPDDVINYIPCLRKNAAKALAIVNGGHPDDIVSGQKVKSFWLNIADPFHGDINNVTIDKHAADIAFGKRTPYKKGEARSIGVRLYRELAQMYVDAANVVGISPQIMQATTWITWRNTTK